MRISRVEADEKREEIRGSTIQNYDLLIKLFWTVFPYHFIIKIHQTLHKWNLVPGAIFPAPWRRGWHKWCSCDNFIPRLTVKKMDPVVVKVSSRGVINHHSSKFAFFRWLNRAHQELSFKKNSTKNMFFSVPTYGVQKFFLYANYFNWLSRSPVILD